MIPVPHAETNGNLGSPNSSHTPMSRQLRLCVTAATRFGQEIAVSYSTSECTSLQSVSAVRMSYEHPELWTITLPSVNAYLRYKYLLYHEDHDAQPLWEVGPDRILDLTLLPSLASQVLVRDIWRASPDLSRNIFSTAAFTRVLFRPDINIGRKLFETRENASFSEALIHRLGSYVITFRVFVERVVTGDCIYVVGNCKELGNDNPSQGVKLADTFAPVWHVSIAFTKPIHQLGYRFLIRRNESIVAEDQVHRELMLSDSDQSFLSAEPGKVSVIYAPSECAFTFEKRWRGAGIVLPVFAIRSGHSCGIGEFTDLITFIDFCRAAGFQLLQLLPVNDTSINDSCESCPYSVVSSFALHPQYLNIDGVGTMPNELRNEYEKEQDRLNRLKKIDMEEVMRVKQHFIRELFKLHRDQILLSAEFTKWFQKHQDWLMPYALFRFFTFINDTAQFDQWGIRSKFSKNDVTTLVDPNSFHFDHLAITYFTQYHLHKQLKAATNHAEKNGVILKGDLPIGVSRYCTDTWVNPHLFRMHMQMGAPPDTFSDHGQNWLFPSYNWTAMRAANYKWWHTRLSHMAQYFHACRVDHILHYFRTWEIPECSRTGMPGRFFPSHAISRQELECLGLWDIDRYSRPYVHDGLLQKLFHDEWWKIKERFFEPLYDRLQFKHMYNTEVKVEHALTLPSDAPEHERKFNEDVMKKLLDLFSNMCLLQDEDNKDLFHPRFMMQTTSSHAELPFENWKRVLYNLQEDYIHRRQKGLWKDNGLERLSMLKAASDMLVCCEDLEPIPEFVTPVMTETNVLSLALQRTPREDADFGIPSKYKYDCVAMTSLHNTTTFRGWWEKLSDDMRMRYWVQVMQRDAKQVPPKECTPELVEWAVTDHLRCPAIWVIFPMQDLLGMHNELRLKDAPTEQISDPLNPSHIWNFRLHIDLDTIMMNKQFIEKLAHLNKVTGRGIIY